MDIVLTFQLVVAIVIALFVAYNVFHYVLFLLVTQPKDASKIGHELNQFEQRQLIEWTPQPSDFLKHDDEKRTYDDVFGTYQTWLSLLLMLALLAWTLDSKGAVGIAVGLVCVIKPQLGILVVWGLMRREWKFTAAIAITVMAFLVVSVIIFGWQVHVEYLQLLGSLSSRGESYYANQSMNGLLNRMLFIGNNLTWDGTHTKVAYDARVYILTLVSSAVIISLVLLHRWRRPAGPLDFALALVGFTLASPVAYEHHFGFLPAVFLLAFLALLGRAAPFIAYMVLAAAFLLSANFIGITDALAASHLNFLQSYMMFGVLLLLGLLAWITEEPLSSDKLSAVK